MSYESLNKYLDQMEDKPQKNCLFFDPAESGPTPAKIVVNPYRDDVERREYPHTFILTRFTWADLWGALKDPLKVVIVIGLLAAIGLSAYIYWAQCQVQAVGQ